MGSFYSNIQLKSNLDKDKFLKCFKTKLSGSFEVCSKEEAEISYRLCFSDNWVTFTRFEYKENPDILNEDAEIFSSLLKTKAFTITMVDSDFALLSLYDNGKSVDNTVVGDGEGYGVKAAPPEQSLWQPLLNDHTFEELSKAWSGNKIFCEDALGKSAHLFGIENENMFVDYQYLDDENSLMLCFKKKSLDGSPIQFTPKLTISTIFKDIFGEALEPMGFQSIKDGAKDDTFVKVIDKELMQVIKCYKAGTKNKYISIGARLITIYECPSEYQKSRGYFWPTPKISTIYYSRHPERYDDEFCRKIENIYYDPNDPKDMVRAVKEGLKYTMQIVIPHFKKVTDLSSYLLVNREIHPTWLGGLAQCRDRSYLENHSDEELLYVKNNYRGDFLEFLQTEKEYTETMEAVKARNFTPLNCPVSDPDEDYSRYYRERIENSKHLRNLLNEILADKDLCEQINSELERRKEINSQILIKMGVNI